MRKSKNISKYHLDWQVTRVLAKDLKTAEEKIFHVLDFLQRFKSIQNHERVFNYLEGLSLGYKKRDLRSYNIILKHIEDLKDKEDYVFSDDNSVIEWDSKLLYKCYKDNMKRYTSYCTKGYFHKELYEFCLSFKCSDKEKIESLKEEASSKPNTHHFFF